MEIQKIPDYITIKNMQKQRIFDYIRGLKMKDEEKQRLTSSILLNKIKEKGIVKNILQMKKQIELYDLKNKLLKKWGTWDKICSNVFLSEDFIREFHHKLTLYNIGLYQIFSEKFIRDFQNELTWSHISMNQQLSENFIIEFQHKVEWYWISWTQKLSEDFIRRFHNKVNWVNICIQQKLSEDFLIEFEKIFDDNVWYQISYYQKLSENFIRKYQDKVIWKYIKIQQNLSEDFIMEFLHRLI